jgi:hypothetical protein
VGDQHRPLFEPPEMGRDSKGPRERNEDDRPALPQSPPEGGRPLPHVALGTIDPVVTISPRVPARIGCPGDRCEREQRRAPEHGKFRPDPRFGIRFPAFSRWAPIVVEERP